MGYDPTSNPSNQTASAAIVYKGRAWVFYYETNGELYVLKSISGNNYSYEPVLDGKGRPILSDDETRPIAVTGNADWLRLYYVEKGTNVWRELEIKEGQKNEDGVFGSYNHKVGLPATVSATIVEKEPRVYFTVQGTEPHFTIGTYGAKWIFETLEAPKPPSHSAS